MTDPLVEQFRGLPTAAVSDALDKLGLPGSALGIAPIFAGAALLGRAFTVSYAPLNPIQPGTVGDYIDDVTAGQVVLLDNDARTDCTVWGDILTCVAHHKGIAGTVISGVCRDTARATSLRYPIYSCGRFMRTGKDRVEVLGVGGPVNIGGVQARAGDVVLGDDDGIVIVPASRAEEVAASARMISDIEDQILDAALKGGSLRAARKQFSYHSLQGRDKKLVIRRRR